MKKKDVFTLNKEFGRKTGTFIFNAARGISHELVKEREESVQYSKIITLKEDSKNYEFLAENLDTLCKEVHEIIQKKNKMYKLVGIHFVQSNLLNKSKSKMLRNPSSSLEELQKSSEQLLKESLETQSTTIRRLGLKVSELSENQGQRNITSFF